MLWVFIFLYSLFILQKSETASDVIVKEVAAGHLAELPCLSSDEHHRFMFWQFGNDDIIGPGNPLNEKKYNYEVLTGTLLIRVSLSMPPKSQFYFFNNSLIVYSI